MQAEGRKRIPLIFFLVLTATLAADQISKALVRAYLPPGEIVKVFGNFLIINQQRNSGIAFSLFTGGSNTLIIIFTLVLVGLLLVYVFWSRETGKLALAGLGLICGGAVGNIIDRFAFKQVIDFVDFSFWPVFNLADLAIVIGVFLFMIGFLKDYAGKEALRGGSGDAS
jgi:signal peptidase II